MRLAPVTFAIVILTASAVAQLRDNRSPEMSCNGNDSNRDRADVCNIQEMSLGPSGQLEIEPGRNGGVTIKGWNQNNVLVRARIEAWANNDADARQVASQVRIEAAGGRIRATGPEWTQNWPWNDERRWAVSFEVFTPSNTDLKVSAHNGGINIFDVRGRMDVESHNGSVHLARIAGDVTGSTHNGSIQVDLEGNTWEGRQLELNAHNGSIAVSVPASFSANVEAKTDRGRVNSDFPMIVRGRIDERNLNFNIGSGGPSIRVSTHNGGIRFRRL